MSTPIPFDLKTWPWECWVDEAGWCVLRDARLQYISDACVEGSVEEFRELYDALERGQSYRAKRCAVVIRPQLGGDAYAIFSPRNTMGGVQLLPVGIGPDLSDIIDRAIETYERERAAGISKYMGD